MEDTGMNYDTKAELLYKIIEKQDKYNKFLSDELNEVVTIAHIHGWRSNRFEQGKQMRDELASLRQQLDECKEKEVMLEDKEAHGAWICPRCQKVHSWLSMTCDCEPNTITSTTYGTRPNPQDVNPYDGRAILRKRKTE